MKKPKQKPDILFLIQLPPPVHGTSVLNKLLTDSTVVQERYTIDVLQIQLANEMTDMGRFSFGKIGNALKIIFRLLRKLLNQKYDLVYLTLSPLSFAFYKDAILVFLAKAFGNKVVLHLHGKGIKEQIKNGLKKRIYKKVFKNTEVIILSEILYEDIAEVYPKKPYILPNGISELPDMEIPVRNDVDKTTFIYLSNLTKDKGILVFLESIRLLKPLENKFRVTLAGPSADVTVEEVNHFIKAHLIENTIAVGPVFGKEKFSHLNMSDVFVLPSKNECFPLTILEAYQSGLAVISTNTGAIPFIVKNEVNGFVLDAEDPVQLANRMQQIMEDRALLVAMKEKNKKEYEEKYTSRIFIHNFISTIDTILKKQ